MQSDHGHRPKKIGPRQENIDGHVQNLLASIFWAGKVSAATHNRKISKSENNPKLLLYHWNSKQNDRPGGCH
jgi:hypothetical protein